MKKSIQITSIVCIILGFSDSSIGQTHPDLSKRKKEQSFEIPQLGIMFRYLPEYDELPAHQSADLNTWRQINIDQFGITFKSPTFYKSSWTKKHSHSYIEPTDSVFELDYGSGVTVQFYESKNKFYEIAFAEDFKQYHKGDTYPFPDGRWDTITRPIYDSSWIMIGLSGMWPKAHFLDGKDWRGLRCKSDTRGYYKSDSMSYSYSAECWFSLLVRSVPANKNLVVFFQQWPLDSNESESYSQKFDEKYFYDLLSTIDLIKDRK